MSRGLASLRGYQEGGPILDKLRRLWEGIRSKADDPSLGYIGASFLPGLGEASDLVEIGAGLQDRSLGRVGLGLAGFMIPFVGAPAIRKFFKGLPMDEVSRLKRAEDMGFDLDVYHATGQKFEGLNIKPSRSGLTGSGIYTSTSPTTHAHFTGMTPSPDDVRFPRAFFPAETARIKPDYKRWGLDDPLPIGVTNPGYLRAPNPDVRARTKYVTADRPLKPSFSGSLRPGSGEMRIYKTGPEYHVRFPDWKTNPRVYPLRVRSNKLIELHGPEWKKIYEDLFSRTTHSGRGFGGTGYSGVMSRDHPDILEMLRQRNLSSAGDLHWDINSLVSDEASRRGWEGIRHHGTGMSKGDDVMMFDPKNIRSPWARFDPSRAQSGDLLAGIAGLAGTRYMLGQNPLGEPNG